MKDGTTYKYFCGRDVERNYNMTPKKRYKKMTAAEKKWNKEFREEMRAKSILPPIKQRLNRKKFLGETFDEFENFRRYSDLSCLYEAIAWMVSRDQQSGITTEQIGVLKTMKIAVALKNYYEQKQLEGETSVSIGELYDNVIQPIRSL